MNPDETRDLAVLEDAPMPEGMSRWQMPEAMLKAAPMNLFPTAALGSDPACSARTSRPARRSPPGRSPGCTRDGSMPPLCRRNGCRRPTPSRHQARTRSTATPTTIVLGPRQWNGLAAVATADGVRRDEVG
jgi:hypothetical protein